MSIFKYLTTEYLLDPFICELLDKNGFNNTKKMQVFNEQHLESILKTASANIDDYKYFHQYSKTQYEEFIKNGKIKLTIKLGDIAILQSLPEIVKSIPSSILAELNPKRRKYVRSNGSNKRKINEVIEDDENVDPNNPRKKTKLRINDTNEEIISNKFLNFVTDKLNVEETRLTEIVLSDDAIPKFLVHCDKCVKKITISYKTSNGGSPTFIKTNYYAHKCNKIIAGSVNED